MIPLQAAKQFVKSNFDDCILALLAGSVARNEQTPTSDLDILVITNTRMVPYKESFVEYGWQIEVFVHSEETALSRMKKNEDQRKCLMANIINDGIFIKGDINLERKLKKIATDFLKKGPNDFSLEEDIHSRYIITEALDDLIGADKYDEQLFIVNELLPKLINYQLVKESQWRVNGKMFPRALEKAGGHFAIQLNKCLHEFYKNNSKKELIQFVTEFLNANGGRYFAGHIQRKGNGLI